MPPLEQDPHSRHFLIQGKAVPRSSRQLGVLWQEKLPWQMNLGGRAAELPPRKLFCVWNLLGGPPRLGQSDMGRRRAKENALRHHAAVFHYSLLGSPKQISEVGTMRPYLCGRENRLLTTSVARRERTACPPKSFLKVTLLSKIYQTKSISP